VSGEYHSLAVLPQGKEPQYPLDRSWPGSGAKRKKSLPSWLLHKVV